LAILLSYDGRSSAFEEPLLRIDFLFALQPGTCLSIQEMAKAAQKPSRRKGNASLNVTRLPLGRRQRELFAVNLFAGLRPLLPSAFKSAAQLKPARKLMTPAFFRPLVCAASRHTFIEWRALRHVRLRTREAPSALRL
jgi:hypothetical protein